MAKNCLNLDNRKRSNSIGLQVLFPASSNWARLDTVCVVQSIITQFNIGKRVLMYATAGSKTILLFQSSGVMAQDVVSGELPQL